MLQAFVDDSGSDAQSPLLVLGGYVSTAERTKRSKYYNKTIVHAIRERRTGTVRARVIPRTTKFEVKTDIVGNVAYGARVYTDESWSYEWAGFRYQHATVNHSHDEYVRGAVHTNGCENFFKCLRMGLKGTYIKATPEHLQAYVDETTFRFNHKNQGEWQRFEAAMSLIVGKRLTYSELTDGAVR